MYKTDVVAHMAKKAGITKAQAKLAFDAFLGTVQIALQNDEKVTLTGFGTFDVRRLGVRKQINPRTLQPMTVPATKIPRFRAGKSLKNALNY